MDSTIIVWGGVNKMRHSVTYSYILWNFSNFGILKFFSLVFRYSIVQKERRCTAPKLFSSIVVGAALYP